MQTQTNADFRLSEKGPTTQTNVHKREQTQTHADKREQKQINELYPLLAHPVMAAAPTKFGLERFL